MTSCSESKRVCQYTPRHYAVTHIQCRNIKEAVILRPDKAPKRANPQGGQTPIMWIHSR